METIIQSVFNRLDGKIRDAVIAVLSSNSRINEIRIRKNSNLFITSGNENIKCSLTVDDEMINKTFDMLCSGTLHSHLETIKNGYIILPEGVRVGVAGRAICENGIIKNVFDVSSLNIRIPYPVYGVSSRIYEAIERNEYYMNVLIYSLPGAGKTTMIRDLAYKLGETGNRRVCVIDNRCEIADERLVKCRNIDIYSGYPKARAIELATRTMNPQYIVCDEIGTYEEANAMLDLQSAGVPIIASAHSRNIVELMKRSNIKLLHDNGVFDTYIGIRRNNQDKIMLSFCSYHEVKL